MPIRCKDAGWQPTSTTTGIISAAAFNFIVHEQEESLPVQCQILVGEAAQKRIICVSDRFS